MSFGAIIRQKREALGFTLDDVSKSIGVSKGHLSEIENNKTPGVSFKVVAQLGFMLRLDLYMLAAYLMELNRER